MGRRVDPIGKPAHNRHPRPGKIPRETEGDLFPIGGTSPCPNDGDTDPLRKATRLPLPPKTLRRVVDLFKNSGIEGIPRRKLEGGHGVGFCSFGAADEGFESTRSRSSLPTLKKGSFLGLTSIDWPVRGFRPVYEP